MESDTGSIITISVKLGFIASVYRVVIFLTEYLESHSTA